MQAKALEAVLENSEWLATEQIGDRLSESAFKVEVDRQPLCQDEYLDSLFELAEHIGIERLFGL
jgi:hypothetical protein